MLLYCKLIKTFSSKAKITDWILALIIAMLVFILIISLMWNIIMPTMAYALNFKSIWDLKFILTESTSKSKEISIEYGDFIGHLMNVLVVVFSIIISMNIVNRVQDLREKMPAK